MVLAACVEPALASGLAWRRLAGLLRHAVRQHRHIAAAVQAC